LLGFCAGFHFCVFASLFFRLLLTTALQAALGPSQIINPRDYLQDGAAGGAFWWI
jgi:hypothetical protein